MSTELSTEQITVSELASEFELKHQLVISELKKIGVWVPSPDTPVDQDIANRIRRRLQLMVEIEQEEQAKVEKAKEKKKAPPRPRKTTRRTIKELGKAQRAKKVEPVEAEVEEEAPVLNPLAGSLVPRKGKASYPSLEESLEEEELLPEKVEVSIQDEPIIEKVEAHVPAEILEALQPPAEEAPPEEAVEQAQGAAPESEAAEPAAPPKEGPPAVGKPPLAPPPRKLKIIRRPPKPAAAPPAAATKPAEAAKIKVPAAAAQAPAPKKPRRKKLERPSEVTLPETVTVKELSERLNVKSKDVLRELMTRGVMATINQSLDQKAAEEIALAFDVVPHFVSFEEAVIEQERAQERPEDRKERAPVVTVMGHVDHGKTSLLDSIRRTDVASGEAGGITQHIGAYHVTHKKKKIVFLDTPGHEAFTMMRARGARATDIVVLVVAADDGVMPQTREAIDHAKAAEVPILVAINKIDKPGADPKRVKQQLSEVELIAEDWGGDTVTVEVSAKAKTNLDQLLEMILLVAELQELTANPRRAASGVVLEARLDKGRGAVATVLVQNGSLAVGDSFIAGTCQGKIRAMFNDRGKAVRKVGPSSAVEILGLQGIPLAGDPFQVVEDTSAARQIVEYRQQKEREAGQPGTSKVSLDDLYSQLKAGEVKELPVVIKADAQGSVEVLRDTLQKLSTEKVKIKVIHQGVGAISEMDVLLASASNAVVIGFNVRPEQNAQATAEKEDVDVRLYTVIYEIAEEIEKAMVGLLEPTLKEIALGRAEVRDTFKVPKFGIIAGCYVLEGKVVRNARARLLRDNVVVYEGKIDSLRRFKEDVNEVKSGYECGISISNFNDLKPSDVIEAFTTKEVAPQLS